MASIVYENPLKKGGELFEKTAAEREAVKKRKAEWKKLQKNGQK